ncbi:MAG TPA: hypothetical protein VMI94_08930 [Bryobacteraceae bacterium]|nr:hypothetical protein [Bryobacteraceae bacterium]
MVPVGRLALCGMALAGGIAAWAQPAVISARSGLIHYVEGQVYVGDQLVDSKFGTFSEVKENQTLRTEEGRAEVLLTPGVFLRLAEHSSFRMITNRLIDTRLEFLSGSAIIEADDIGKDNSVTVVYQNATVHPVKKGLYRFDASPAELRVYDGEADVTLDDHTLEAKEGHLVALDTLAERKFDRTVTDALNRWSERRGEYVSMASVGAANSLRTSLYDGGSAYGTFGTMGAFGVSGFMGGWYWNPYLGMYSFVPGMSGDWFSAYGFPFWSPFNVYMAYMPGYYYFPYSYYGGYYGGYPAGYSGAYNSGGYHSVPAPTHTGRSAAGGIGTVASGHGPYHGGGISRGGGMPTSSSPAGSVGRISAPPPAAPSAGSIGGHVGGIGVGSHH